MLDVAEEDPAELRAGKSGLSYVSLDGNIGCLVNGAGLAMSTMDLIKYHGGEPANFLDVGGGANKDQVLEGVPHPARRRRRSRRVLVNIFGGIMKCDMIAAALLAAYDEIDFRVPAGRPARRDQRRGRQEAPRRERPQDHHRRRPDRRGQEGRRRGEGRGLSGPEHSSMAREPWEPTRWAESRLRPRSRMWRSSTWSRKGCSSRSRFIGSR